MSPIGRYRGLFKGKIYIACSIQVILIFFLVSSCGKKGAPTLSSYEKPPAPVSLVVSQKEDAVFLSWNYPPGAEKAISGFLVLRSSPAGFKKIAGLGSGARSFIDIDVKEGSAYTYKVVSQNYREISSPDSNAVTATVVRPPEPPSRISWNIDGDSLILSWEKTGAGVLYNVYKAYSKGTYVDIPANITPLSESSFRDLLPLDRPVFYYLRSLVRNGVIAEGRPSSEIMITPDDLLPAPPEEVRWFAAADRIYVYWKEPDMTWIKGFRIYRRFASEEEYALIGETQLPSFVDKEAPRQRRSYRLSAIGPSREGPAAEIDGVGFVSE
jgi:hypothetical protein